MSGESGAGSGEMAPGVDIGKPQVGSNWNRGAHEIEHERRP